MKKMTILFSGVFLTSAMAFAGNESLARATPGTLEGDYAKIAYQQILQTGAPESPVTKNDYQVITTVSGTVGGDSATCTKTVTGCVEETAVYSCTVLYNW